MNAMTGKELAGPCDLSDGGTTADEVIDRRSVVATCSVSAAPTDKPPVS
jgi:hypothetical protein